MKNLSLRCFYIAIFMAIILLLINGCAAIKASSCTTNAAYSTGVNDARNQHNMSTNYASICDSNNDAINTAYREGYQSVNSNNQNNGISSGPQCINNFGDKICGYNCVKSINNVRCASTSDQQCLADNFGNIACGYGCIKSINEVKCAPNPNQNCVTDTAGNIICGKNCVEKYGRVKCDDRKRHERYRRHNNQDINN